MFVLIDLYWEGNFVETLCGFSIYRILFSNEKFFLIFTYLFMCVINFIKIVFMSTQSFYQL